MHESKFMDRAIELATQNVATGHGGPFGAVVVKDGVVIAEAVNEVTTLNDPTAHAEILAIREACRVLGSFQLTGCTVYASCEPCPMCLAALYWARPDRVFYAATRDEAAAAGFDDALIYEELARPATQRNLNMGRIPSLGGQGPFEAWRSSEAKLTY